MTVLDAFLYGMPFVLMAGAGATLWFARRAAAEIRSHSEPKAARSVVVNDGGVVVTRVARHPQADKVNEAA